VWGTDRVFALSGTSRVRIGAGASCDIRLVDPRTSRRHATVVRHGNTWLLRDAGSKNGILLDGATCSAFALQPGCEVRIGGVTLIAESERSIALRGYLARIVGWAADRNASVDRALRSIRMAARHRAPLVLCGDTDLVAIAHGIHRIALGADRPFVSCDPRRGAMQESARAVQNYPTGRQAFAAAAGGSVCVVRGHMPPDFAELASAIHAEDARVQLVICSTRPVERDTCAAPIIVPPLAARSEDELSRIVDEYACDAVAELEAPHACFTAEDRSWVIEHAASLAEIEKATRRVVALRACGNVNRAAARLGISHVGLFRWIARRRVKPVSARA
jgi:hypothetical protein